MKVCKYANIQLYKTFKVHNFQLSHFIGAMVSVFDFSEDHFTREILPCALIHFDSSILENNRPLLMFALQMA